MSSRSSLTTASAALIVLLASLWLGAGSAHASGGLQITLDENSGSVGPFLYSYDQLARDADTVNVNVLSAAGGTAQPHMYEGPDLPTLFERLGLAASAVDGVTVSDLSRSVNLSRADVNGGFLDGQQPVFDISQSLNEVRFVRPQRTIDDVNGDDANTIVSGTGVPLNVAIAYDATPITLTATASPTSAQPNAPIEFSVSGAGGAPLQYTWTWNDGATTSGPSTTAPHAFSNAGTYDVTVTGIGGGLAGAATVEVTIGSSNTPAPPGPAPAAPGPTGANAGTGGGNGTPRRGGGTKGRDAPSGGRARGNGRGAAKSGGGKSGSQATNGKGNGTSAASGNRKQAARPVTPQASTTPATTTPPAATTPPPPPVSTPPAPSARATAPRGSQPKQAHRGGHAHRTPPGSSRQHLPGSTTAVGGGVPRVTGLLLASDGIDVARAIASEQSAAEQQKAARRSGGSGHPLTPPDWIFGVLGVLLLAGAGGLREAGWRFHGLRLRRPSAS